MITVKNVTKKYGKFKAVDNISFEVNDGEIIGLLGPNGAGKSTTMNILTGFMGLYILMEQRECFWFEDIWNC